MIRKQLLIGILAAMTVALPAVGIYAVSAKASEIQISNEDTVSGNKGASIDKAVTLQNSVKMTDQISAAVNGENIMFSPTSLNFALGMIAEGAKGETKEVLCNYLGTDDFASYAKEYLNKIKEYNTEDESYGYKSKLKIPNTVANVKTIIRIDRIRSVKPAGSKSVPNKTTTTCLASRKSPAAAGTAKNIAWL